MSMPDHEAGPPRLPASERLRLEIELLAATTASSEDAATAEPGRTVLVAVGDAGLREYIAQCLRQRADVRVVELRPGERHSHIGPREAVALVITDEHASTAWSLHRPPLLLIGDEPSEELPLRERAGVALLSQPFNARQLLDVVARLLSG